MDFPSSELFYNISSCIIHLGHFEEMSKELLKSKLDITRCLLRDAVFLGDEWFFNALLSLYSLAVDTLLPLYTFTLHKPPLNSWHTLLEWGKKDPIPPTPFKCFQGEKGPIQRLEEVLWWTLVRYFSCYIHYMWRRKKGFAFNQAQGHLHNLFFFPWMSTGKKK